MQESTFAAARWSAGAHVLKQVLQLGFGILLLRLLSPEPYGLVAMATVVTGFISVVGNLGFDSALVQRRELREHHATAAFWASLALGLLLTGSAVGAAPWIASFYGERAVSPVLQALAVLFVLGAIAAAPKALLQRRLDFRSLARLEIFALTASGALALSLAWMGAGVWSLVMQRLTAAALEASGVWILVRWRPAFSLSVRGVRDLAGYSLNLTGFNLINYWARRIDDLLIGRVMGPVALGFYDRAYSLMLLPIRQVIGSISRVMLPALSTIQDDKPRMRRLYLRVVRVVAMVAFPMMAGLAVVADVFVIGVLGEQWAPAIPIIRIFCGVGAMQALANPTGWIYTSTGRTDWMMRWGLGGGSVLIVAISVGVLLGSVEAVAWAYAVANVLLLYPVIAIPGRLIDLSFHDVVRAVSPGAAAAVAMGITLVALRMWMPAQWLPLTELLILLPLGMFLYLLFSVSVNREGCREVLFAVEGMAPRWRGSLRAVRAALS